jgi:hypothetical protein
MKKEMQKHKKGTQLNDFENKTNKLFTLRRKVGIAKLSEGLIG